MTNKERTELIQNAIRDYKFAQESGSVTKIRHAINNMENTYFAINLWNVPGAEDLRKMIFEARKIQARRFFNFYKCELKKISKLSRETREIRYNTIQYVCSFPKIDPAKMAASLHNDGFAILFDDSSISAKENALHRALVNKTIKKLTNEELEGDIG